jgi:hypothetical protein
MGDPFKKVTAGQRLKIPAAAYNAFIDAARAAAAAKGRTAALPLSDHPPDTVLIRNSSGYDIQRFGTLRVTGVLIGPEDEEGEPEDSFLNQWALEGIAPLGEPEEMLAITIEPIAQDAIGRACLGGHATPAQVLFPRIGDTFVEADPTSPQRLKSRLWYGGQGVVRTSGPADPGTLAWALVDRRVPALSIGWAKIAANANEPWYHTGPFGPRCYEEHWTHANPCRDRLGTDVDVTTDLSVLLHVDSLVVAGQCGARDPNLVVGDVIQVLQVPGQVEGGSSPLYVCLSNILDDALGTVKMWCGNGLTTDQIPRGWMRLQEVVEGGLPDGAVPGYNDDYMTWLTKTVIGTSGGSPGTIDQVYLCFIVRVV